MTQKQMAEYLTEHRKRLYAIARGMMGNEQDALDAVAETAYRACLKCGSLKQAAAVAGWLSAITVNCCRMALRRRRPQVPVEDVPLQAPDTASGYEMRALVEQLPLPEREIVLLRYYGDMRYTEIAKCLHTPESTVRARHQRALKALKLQVEGEVSQ